MKVHRFHGSTLNRVNMSISLDCLQSSIVPLYFLVLSTGIWKLTRLKQQHVTVQLRTVVTPQHPQQLMLQHVEDPYPSRTPSYSPDTMIWAQIQALSSFPWVLLQLQLLKAEWVQSKNSNYSNQQPGADRQQLGLNIRMSLVFAMLRHEAILVKRLPSLFWVWSSILWWTNCKGSYSCISRSRNWRANKKSYFV